MLQFRVGVFQSAQRSSGVLRLRFTSRTEMISRSFTTEKARVKAFMLPRLQTFSVCVQKRKLINIVALRRSGCTTKIIKDVFKSASPQRKPASLTVQETCSFFHSCLCANWFCTKTESRTHAALLMNLNKF